LPQRAAAKGGFSQKPKKPRLPKSGIARAPTRMATDSARDIRERAFVFGCAVARLALAVVPKPGIRSLVDQLLKAGTSVGANLEEAKAGSSRREFLRYLEIALREARESLYWLRIWSELELAPAAQLRELQGEADQIVRILTAIVVNTKRLMLFGSAVSAF
jgi:four helix bundle protein